MSDESGGKKGMHPMAWVGIGCGVFVLVGIIVVAMVVGWGVKKGKQYVDEFDEHAGRAFAQLVINENRDLEMVSSDDLAGMVTLRQKSTGEVITLSYEDIQNGRFSVTTNEGTTTVGGTGGVIEATNTEGETTTVGGGGGIEKMPLWFEVPGGVTGWRAAVYSERGDQVTALVSGVATLPITELEAAMKKSLGEAGFAESERSAAGTGTSMSFVNETEGRSVTVSMFEKGGNYQVHLTYAGKK